MLKNKHLLGLEGYPREDIQTIIETAFNFREVLDRPIKKVPSLQGVTIVNLFFENSTRTKISFELAQKRLCLLYTSPSPRDLSTSRMPSSA